MRIDLQMTLGIMPLDMRKIRRIPKRRYIPVEMPHPSMQRGIPTADITDVALEVLDIHDVETNNSRVQADVGFGQAVAEVVRTAAFLEIRLSPVKGVEEGGDRAFVGVLFSFGVLLSRLLFRGGPRGGERRLTWQTRSCRHRC